APVPSKDVIARSAGLAAAFRAKGLPVVLVNVTGGAPGRNEAPQRGEQPPADWADLVADLDAQDSDIRVTKQTWGAFYGTDLDSQLRRRGITQVVLTGIATSIGVESTAR
ncbi:isochorismatase family protein, partial [Streptomyces sp. SID11233]|nr:isochorismatase family protein [Streptomyces sp. SID11233]